MDHLLWRSFALMLRRIADALEVVLEIRLAPSGRSSRSRGRKGR